MYRSVWYTILTLSNVSDARMQWQAAHASDSMKPSSLILANNSIPAFTLLTPKNLS